MIAPARLAAYDALRAISDTRADLPHALAHTRDRLPDERDRALAGEIVTGTLRWQGAFDYVIRAYTKRAALDPEVRDVLRLTMFQLLHLDRVPASAAVNDAVDLTRRAGKGSAAPLVNAVLRRISRERSALPLPPRPAEPIDRDAALAYLSDTLSHPRWLASRWLERYGFDAAAAWEQFDNRPAPLTLRANRLKTGRDELSDTLATHGVRTRPARFAPDGLIVESGNPLLLPVAGDGLFVVQDESSQLVPLFAAVQPGERVLDACASPGGKTTAMAASMDDRGVLVATDVRERRIDLLARTVRASGARSVRIVQADAALPLPFAASFDCVVVDAPCSGLGTLRRDPDVRWRRSEQALPAMADLQIRILEASAAVVRTGGRIVYSTCSSEPDENEAVVERFLARHPEFTAAPPRDLPELVWPLVSDAGQLRTLPFRDGLEAFFAAMLVKK